MEMAAKIHQVTELEAMIPDRQGTDTALSAPVSSQQASESIIVQIEQVEESNYCCLR